MRVLVTGGAGYIGSETARHFADAGHDPVVFDDLSTGSRAAVAKLPLVVGDVADPEAVAAALHLHEIEAIVHFAALKSVAASMDDPAIYFSTNVSGTFAVLRAAVAAGVRRLVYSSSAAVYGSPDRLPVDESAPLRPENPYGESKLLVERALAWFDVCSGVRSVTLRYFNAAGAAFDGRHGEDPRVAANLVPLAIDAALGRRPPVPIFGLDYPTPDGTAIRDYVHVADLAEGHRRALDHLAAGGPSRTINLGTGKGSSVRDVLRAIERVSGVAVPAIPAGRRRGDPPAVWAKVDRARSVLGWSAKHDLDAIAESAWAWQASHAEGYETAATASSGAA